MASLSSAPATRLASARLKALRASNEAVVARARGTSIARTEASDSPRRARRADAATPSASSTAALSAARSCSTASESPVAQASASSVIAYAPPSSAIVPLRTAWACSRLHTSRATSAVSRASAGRPVRRNVSRTRTSGTTFRYGDCRMATASAACRVSSNAGSPVRLATSASTTWSRSVSAGAVFLQAWSLRGKDRMVKIKASVGDRSVDIEYPEGASEEAVQELIQKMTDALTPAAATPRPQ